MSSTLFILFRLLDKLKIAYDKEDIKLRLISDVRYPSLLSITHILDFLNISHTPVQTDFDHLKNSKLNKIVHIKDESNSSFATIEKIDNNGVTYYDGNMHTIPTNDFKRIWSKVAIFINMSKSPKNSFFIFKKIYPLIYIIPGMLFIFIRFQGEFYLIHLLAFTGIIISFHLIQIENDRNYYSKFCQISPKINCRKVVASKMRLFSYYISLADCNFIIYSSIIICLLIPKEPTLYAYLITIFSLCLTQILVFLIVYQAYVLKHWCILCLCTSVIYLLTGSYYFIYFQDYNLNISLLSPKILAILILSFLTSFLITICLKKHLNTLKQYKNERIASFLLKRNSYVIKQLITEENYLDLDYQNAISLGNKSSSITISTVITPFCPHCKVVIKEMFYLIKNYPIKWIIIWNGLLSSANVNQGQLFWEELYKVNEREFSLRLYRFANGIECKATNIEVSEQTKKHFFYRLRLLETNKIDKSPTIPINGKILSRYYNMHDFRYILNELIELKI